MLAKRNQFAATGVSVKLFHALPEDKRTEVADFARFLLSKSGHPDDAAWEARLAYSQPRPKLEAFLREAAAEGDEPLDPKRL